MYVASFKQGDRMFLSNLLKLGLYKSSCILFSCLFFVSCNTVSNKPTEVVSNAGSRKIASASAAAMAVNSSAFLMMQACPVLASIQSRIPSWRGTADRDEHINRYNAEYVMNMLKETDSQGRTLHQRLMLELSSDSDCLSRIGDLRENICFYREYSEACEALHRIDKLDGETIIQEFEQFAGAKIESIDPSQLAGKIDEFINSRDIDTSDDLYFGAVKKVAAAAADEILLPFGIIAMIIAAPLTAVAAAAAGAGAAVGVAIGAVSIFSLQWYDLIGYNKRIKNRKRPENP